MRAREFIVKEEKLDEFLPAIAAGARAIGGAAVQGAKAVGQGVVKAGQTVGNLAQKGATAVGDAATNVAGKVANAAGNVAGQVQGAVDKVAGTTPGTSNSSGQAVGTSAAPAGPTTVEEITSVPFNVKYAILFTLFPLGVLPK